MGGPNVGGYEELRVHGVAGTPPESMLQLAAVPDEPPPKECDRPSGDSVQIYRSPPAQPRVRAFSWSSLTSGSAVMALWMLLLPYMLANVAGWAMLPLTNGGSAAEGTEGEPPERSWPLRFVILFVRLGGLLVTAIFVLAMMLTLVDVVGYQVVAKRWEWQGGPAGGLGAAAAVMLVLFAATCVRRPGVKVKEFWQTDVCDPVGYAWLDENQHLMWNSPGIILRLRRLHLAFGWGLVALVGMWTLYEETRPWTVEDNLVTMLAAFATLFPLALLGGVTLSGGRDLGWSTLWIRHVGWIVSLAAVAGAVWRMAETDLTDAEAAFLPAIRGSAAWAAIVLLLVVAGAAFVSCRFARRDRSPSFAFFNLPSLLLTAATVAAIFGVGLAAQVAKLLGERVCEEGATDCQLPLGPVVNWVAVGFTWMLTALLWIVAGRFAVAFVKAGGGEGRLMRSVRRMTDNVSILLATLVAIGSTALVVGLGAGFLTNFGPVRLPAWVEWTSAIAFFLPLVLAALALYLRLSCVARFVVPVVVAGAVIAVVRFDLTVEVAGVALPPSSFLDFARLLAITLPTGLLLTRVVSGFRNREERRTLAIAWDLGNFWPRWFHPFAPPTYSDVAVKRLRATMDEHLRREPVLLAPHSQGSIISAAVVAAADPRTTKRLAYVTYGSPVSRLYSQAFPAVFTREALAAICERLVSDDGTLRWRNLFRPTDPIGGRVMASPPGVPESAAAVAASVDVEVPAVCGRSHSDYPKEPAYETARADLLATLGVGPG